MSEKMSLSVELAPVDRLGRLYPAYDEQAQALVMWSDPCTDPDDRTRRIAHFLNISGLVEIRLDRTGLLRHVSLMEPRELWTVVDHFPDVSAEVLGGNVLFRLDALGDEYFSLPVVVETNRERTQVRMQFQLIPGRARLVELSDRCWAMVADDRLLGFHAVLPDPVSAGLAEYYRRSLASIDARERSASGRR